MSKFNIASAAGGSNRAVIKSYPGINVKDGKLTVVITGINKYPLVSGIEVLESSLNTGNLQDEELEFNQPAPGPSLEDLTTSLRVYPNPIVDEFNVELAYTEAERTNFELIDPMGRSLNIGEYFVPQGNSVISFNTANMGLVSGIYYRRVRSKQLENVVYKLLINL